MMLFLFLFLERYSNGLWGLWGLWKVARGLKENSSIAYHKTLFENENQIMKIQNKVCDVSLFIKSHMKYWRHWLHMLYYIY